MIECWGQVKVSIADLPEEFRTNPAYACWIELVRYMPKRRKLYVTNAGNVYADQGQGLYHPSTWNGVAGTSGSGGTRGGATNGTSVPRITQWDVIGLPFGGSYIFNVGDIFAPFFDFVKINDYAGGSLLSATYYIGRTKRSNPKGVWSYAPNPVEGVFYFRYSIFNPATQRRESGPNSEPIFVRVKKWPTRPDPGGVAAYPHLRQVSVDNPALRQLVVTVGGGRVR